MKLLRLLHRHPSSPRTLDGIIDDDDDDEGRRRHASERFEVRLDRLLPGACHGDGTWEGGTRRPVAA